MDNHSVRPGARFLWWTHVTVLALVGGYIALSALFSTPDANIGLGLGLLMLGALGAPWTLPALLADRLTLDSGPFVVLAIVGALLNLALHAAVSHWRGKREG